MTDQQFDVFLAHSSKDKPLIRQIYRQLKARGIKPWLDEEEIAPGTQFQDEIQQAIGQIKTAAICIGEGDLGRWQALELKAFISQCVERNIPVIPVLLPDVESIPNSLLFLKEFHAVFFREDIHDERAFFQLEWGITGRKPKLHSEIPEVKPLKPIATLEDDLSSEKGIDYQNLQHFLERDHWKEADEETEKVMLQAMEKDSWFDVSADDILSFPCKDLKTIDSLWVKCSKGRFGFSVQKQIYVECGADLYDHGEYDEVWKEFCDRTGWRLNGIYPDYPEIYFDTAPQGHLPVFWEGDVFLIFTSLISRLETCSK